MAAWSDQRIALLSVHPQHAEAILDGRKTVELRRSFPIADVTHVVVYATSPVQRIVGWFSVAGVHSASPEQIWNDHGARTAVAFDDFREYFQGSDQAVAILVGICHRLEEPIGLDTLPSNSRPPQSFRYLRHEDLDALPTLSSELGSRQLLMLR